MPAKKTLLIFLFISFIQAFSSFGVPVSYRISNKNAEKPDCPVIDYSKLVIKQPACDDTNGSITGLSVTSAGRKILYIWRDANNTIVGHSINLTKIPAGTYTLQVIDNSGCPTLTYSTPIVVENANGITIDDSNVSIRISSCTKGTGAISGIKVTGATKYEWRKQVSGVIVSTSTTTADLKNVPVGDYQLFLYNSACQLTSKVYYVNSTLQVPAVVDVKITNPDCALSNGSIVVTLETGFSNLKFFFADSQGNRLSDGIIVTDNTPILKLSGLDGGVYNLYIYDSHYCTELLGSYNLPSSVLSISQTETAVTNDKCNQHLGAIVPVIENVEAGTRDILYTWTDVNTGQVVGKNKVLNWIGAGTYQLVVQASSECRAVAVFNVINVSPALIPPAAQGSTLCLPGQINITATNPDTAQTFKLYAEANDNTPIDSNKTGIFYRQVDKTTDFYISRVHGDCESERTKVTETILVALKIPNTITPNNDGINDTWNLTGIEKFPGADVRIFTRNGQLLFHSINYPSPFDGTINGTPLPTGVYYYIIDVKQPVCFGKIAGSLTILR
ncbi:MAG: gliding motility-associated C-terminal domain-containing protein [Mucilaginibacter sp.]|nr:gliding motility-associated C-terminal domain-containing protein [Mucilaginibacter sp.]